MDEKLKEVREAVEVLEKCIIPLEPENKSIKTILSLARTVLEAGEVEIYPGKIEQILHTVFTEKVYNENLFEEQAKELVKYFRQAVLPVVAKKDMIIAEQAKRIEDLERRYK